jgi:hypothetical protein
MVGAPDSTRVLSALLEPDGTILLQVHFSGSPEPVSATIDPIETTIRAAGARSRPVHLEYGDPRDRHLRLIVAMHADALAYERQARSHPPDFVAMGTGVL